MTIADRVRLLRAWMPGGPWPKPATDARFAALEARLGFPVPAPLQDLWRQVDGHAVLWPLTDRGYPLIPTDEAGVEDLAALVGDDPGALADEATGLAPEELASKAWVVFAGIDHDRLLLCRETGRIAVTEKAWPPICRVADSLDAFLAVYCDAIAAGRFTVADGHVAGPDFDTLFALERTR